MPKLQYLETHVVDQCNLNCRGCSHFSPIAKTNNYSFNEFEKDIYRLAELINEIEVFRLLGGEPFIANNLTEYIKTVRQTFPSTDLRIVTNGLLLRNADKLVLKIIKENNVQLDISIYTPTQNVMHEIIEILVRHDLRHSFLVPIQKFKKRITLSTKCNNVTAFKNCSANNCTFLYKGKISACPGPSLCYLLNDRFDTKLNGDADVIDIHSIDITGKQIEEFIRHPLDLCKHCGNVLEFPWEQCTAARLSDWAIDA